MKNTITRGISFKVKNMIPRLLAFLLIGLLITSCTDNELSEGIENSSGSNADYQYISLKIKTSSDPESRGDADNGLNYEYGSESENYVNLIRFYFFDEDGNKTGISDIQDAINLDNYYDWTAEEDVNDTDVPASEDIEKTITVDVPLIITEDNIPSQVFAVVNPNEELMRLGSMSLNELQNCVLDFETDLTNHNFVMSNSVYASREVDETLLDRRNIISAVSFTEENIGKNESIARQNPVTIYVERLVARIDVSFSENLSPLSIPGHQNVFPVRYKETPGGQENEIYVEFLGWGITSTPSKSRLVKLIDRNWKDSEFFGSAYSWNRPDLYRSLWAVNPAEVSYETLSYTALTGKTNSEDVQRDKKCFAVDVTKTGTTYMQENANPYNEGIIQPAGAEQPTKVIFAARLLDASGNPVNLAEYNNKFYTVNELKTLVTNYLDMYFEDNSSSPVKYTKIREKDLEIVTSLAHAENSDTDTGGTYNVYFQLTKEAEEKIWYHNFNSDDDKERNLISDPNGYIDSMLFPAKIWNNGFTYYYFEIPHYDEAGNLFLGVVRNHIYNATINEILSLGTPVYKPDDKIITETPPNSGKQLDVTVRTIKWRRESQNVQFTW